MAAIIATLAAPWLLPPTLLAIAGYLVYLVLEAITGGLANGKLIFKPQPDAPHKEAAKEKAAKEKAAKEKAAEQNVPGKDVAGKCVAEEKLGAPS
jgi:hypothetical protein